MASHPPISGAARVRRHRARKQRGVITARMEFTYDDVICLIDMGLLTWAQQEDPDAIGKAIHDPAAVIFVHHFAVILYVSICKASRCRSGLSPTGN